MINIIIFIWFEAKRKGEKSMQAKGSKRVLAILVSLVLLMCSFSGTFTVSAGDPLPVPTVVNGKTYFIAAAAVNGAQPAVSLDLNGDGNYEIYNTVSFSEALTGALSKTAADKPVVGVYGAQGTWLPNATGTTPIEVVGVTSDASITTASYGGVSAPITFKNIKFTPASEAHRIIISGKNVTFGEGVNIDGKKMWMFPIATIPTEDTVKVVIDSEGFRSSYFCILGSDGSGVTGSASDPKYVDVTINNMSMYNQTNSGSGYANCGAIVLGPRGGNGTTFYGNVVLRVNGGSYPDKKIYVRGNSTFTGTVSVIANSSLGMSIDSTATGQVDYFVVNDNANGKVDIKDIQAATPTFVLTPNNAGYIPFVNGRAVQEVNGVYEYTPTRASSMQTLNVTYGLPTASRLYTIYGEQYAFAAVDGEVTYESATYRAYSTLEQAYKAIAASGGNIVVEGEHSLYTEQTTTKPIRVIGLGTDKTTIVGKHNGVVWGEISFRDLTYKSGDASGTDYFYVDRFTFESNVARNGYLWVIGFRTTQPGSSCYFKNTSGSMEMLCLQGNATSNAQYIFDGGYLNWDTRVNGTVDGSMTYIFNNVSMWNNRKVAVSKNPSGKLSVVFNNGINTVTIADTNNYVDYVLNVATGGYAYVKTEGTATTAPTFVISTPSETVAPVIDGEQLRMTAGEYLYTPDKTGTIDITFAESTQPHIYQINRKPFAFVAADGEVEYGGETRYAYETLELAYKEIIGEGGTIVMEGTQTIYTESTAAKPIRILGLGAAQSTLINKHYGVIYGEVEIDNLTFKAGSSNQDNFYVDRFTAGEDVATSGTLWIIGFRSSGPSGTTCYADLKGGSFDLINTSHENESVSASRFDSIRIIQDGAYVNWDLRSTKQVYGNVAFIINSDEQQNQKKISIGNNPTGNLSLVFNNGVEGFTVDDVNGYVDYVLNVAKGGSADIKFEGTATTAPTFVITAPAGKRPLVNGVALEKVDGEYLYTPTARGTMDITFDYPNSYVPNITVPSGEELTITKLQTDSRTDPLGLDDTTPALSWILESARRGAKQTAYRVGVASSVSNIASGKFDVWDSGKVTSSDTSIVYGAINGTGGKTASTLKAQTIYYWTVYAWNENGVENRSSQIGTFEMALLGDFGNGNYWITAKAPTSGTAADTAGRLFRKQFTLSQSKNNVAKARLYSTAAGNQIMYVNGKRAADDYFAPGKSKYTQMFYYQTYDVTDLLMTGNNTIGAEVGQGWYNAGAVAANYGSNVALKAKLVVTYRDGSQQVINTDSSWQGTMQGATLSNRFYDGQVIDGREYIKGWATNNNTSSKWQAATASATHTTNHGSAGSVFVAENMEPVRNILTLKPSLYEDLSNYVTTRLYTFDQNIAGTVRITAKAKAGVKMTVKYSEFLTNGTITGDEYNGQNGTDSYVFRGDEDGETVVFDLVYHGFQYVLITNESNDFNKTSPIEILSVEGLVLSSDVEETMEMETSNATINQYIQNVLWSLRGNFVSTLTDCPTREKNTWTGDAQIISGAAVYYADAYNLFRNFQLMTQHSAMGDGGLPEIVPEATKTNGSSSENKFTTMPAGWTDSATIVTWQLYNQFGDTEIITDNYSMMKNFVDCLVNQRVYQAGDEVPYFVIDPTDLRLDGGRYGDWLSKSNGNAKSSYYEKMYYATEYSSVGAISHAEMGTAYLAHSCDLLSKMAAAIGKTSDATRYNNLYKRFAAAWRKNFVAADGYTCTSNGTSTKKPDGSYTYTPGEGWVTSYALGLEFNLFENEEKAAKAAEKLASLMKGWDYQQMIGFMGADTLYTALSHNGQFDAALKIFENEQNPSLLYSVTQGATTIWETYDGGTYSRNHYVFGAPSRFLFSDVLGITHGYENENVGYTHFVLAPHYSSDSATTLTSAKGSYTARTGVIKSEWTLSSDRKTFTYNCTVPANTTATLSLPLCSADAIVLEGGKDVSSAEGVTYIKTEDGRAYYELQSGSYAFVVAEMEKANVQVDMLTGAEVRFANPSGLRFTTLVSGLDALPEGATYEAHTLIAPLDYVNALTEFTPEGFEAAGLIYLDIELEKEINVGDAKQYQASIVNIRESNFTRQFAARTYVTITYANGVTETIYSDYVEQNHARSIRYVAQMELTYGSPNELEEEVLLSFGAVKQNP